MQGDGGGVGDEHAVVFVLPADMDSSAAPKPTNPNVSITTMPPTLSAAVRYSGRWSQSSSNDGEWMSFDENDDQVAADGARAAVAVC